MNEHLKTSLRERWVEECAAARSARRAGDRDGVWHHLERAHIVSQPLATLHVRTHGAMLAQGFRERSVKEVVGQISRSIVAAPGSLLGRYPVGNTGRADVSAFRAMPIPEDLQLLLNGSDVAPTGVTTADGKRG